MSLLYLLDTNIVSFLVKRRKPWLQARFEAMPGDSMAISAITEAEVMYGLARNPGAIDMRLGSEAMFHSIPPLVWNSAAARTYGRLRAEQEQKGRPLSTEDMMIAAHALSLNLTLVTNDGAFSFVEGLRTEDWTAA